MIFAGVRSTQREVATFGSALSDYGGRHGLSAHSLAAYLGCSEQALSSLARRRCPDPNDARFEGEIVRIAQVTGCYVWQLREIALTVATKRG